MGGGSKRLGSYVALKTVFKLYIYIYIYIYTHIKLQKFWSFFNTFHLKLQHIFWYKWGIKKQWDYIALIIWQVYNYKEACHETVRHMTNKFLWKSQCIFNVMFKILRRLNEATTKSTVQDNAKTTVSLKLTWHLKWIAILTLQGLIWVAKTKHLNFVIKQQLKNS